MLDQKFSRRHILLDGGMGRELRFRGVDVMTSIWSAKALIEAPQVVREVHRDFIAAGADIITINSYGIVKRNLAWAGIEDRFKELNLLACNLAREARDAAGRAVLIAGSLPPLAGSFRPDRVGKLEEIEPLYREQAEVLAPHVDLLLCETMSSIDEGRAAAAAATRTGKPVWVCWTLHEDRSGRLRSGEDIGEAVRSLSDLPCIRGSGKLLRTGKYYQCNAAAEANRNEIHRRICKYISTDSRRLGSNGRQADRWIPWPAS